MGSPDQSFNHHDPKALRSPGEPWTGEPPDPSAGVPVPSLDGPAEAVPLSLRLDPVAAFLPGANDGFDGFSLLNLRDRVVIMLLFDQVVREDQVRKAWQLWQQMGREGGREPLWRVLALFPDLDRELIFAEAARVYGFEEAHIARQRALGLIRKTAKQMDREVWDQMMALRVIPIAEMEHHQSKRRRLIFATPDPTSPEIHRLMTGLEITGFELRYAPERQIMNLLAEAFPYRFAPLKSGAESTPSPAAGFTFWESVWQGEAAETGEEAAPAEGARVRFDRSGLLALFEEILVEAVRQEATDACLLPNPQGQTEIYLQVGEDLRRWRVEDRVEPRTFLGLVKKEIIHATDAPGGIQKRNIQRWIDERLVQFRVSALPASASLPSECVVVRVLD